MSALLGSLRCALFDRGGVRALFDHVGHLILATIIMAAGLNTAGRSDAGSSLHTLIPAIALSYLVTAIGALLIVISFVDALHRLRRFRRHIVLQSALGVIYLIVSFRVIQVVLFYRTHSC